MYAVPGVEPAWWASGCVGTWVLRGTRKGLFFIQNPS